MVKIDSGNEYVASSWCGILENPDEEQLPLRIAEESRCITPGLVRLRKFERR